MLCATANIPSERAVKICTSNLNSDLYFQNGMPPNPHQSNAMASIQCFTLQTKAMRSVFYCFFSPSRHFRIDTMHKHAQKFTWYSIWFATLFRAFIIWWIGHNANWHCLFWLHSRMPALLHSISSCFILITVIIIGYSKAFNCLLLDSACISRMCVLSTMDNFIQIICNSKHWSQ